MRMSYVQGTMMNPMIQLQSRMFSAAASEKVAVKTEAKTQWQLNKERKKETFNSPIYQFMCKRYDTYYKTLQFPKQYLNLKTEFDVVAMERRLRKKYGFDHFEVKRIMKHRPSFMLINEEFEKQRGIKNLVQILVVGEGLNKEAVRSIVLNHPPILGKSKDDFEKYYSLLESMNIPKKEATKLLFECPRIISMNLEKQFKEFFFLFELYNKMPKEDVITIFRSFPHMICTPIRKMTLFNGQFKKYKMTRNQIMNVCINSGGLLGSSVSNFKGIFDTLKVQGIKASEVLDIMDDYPKFALQNRQNMLLKKISFITEECGRNHIYMRNFIKRHPDIVMKSYASLDAKVNYVGRILNRILKHERAFPLLLHFNYNTVIKPRGDILKQRLGAKGFDLHTAFCHPDDKFCEYYGIDPDELREAKVRRSRANNTEQDVMWTYVQKYQEE